MCSNSKIERNNPNCKCDEKECGKLFGTSKELLDHFDLTHMPKITENSDKVIEFEDKMRSQ